MDFAQVQVVKVAILAIVVGTLVVLGIAYTEGVFNKPADPPYEGYPDTITVEQYFYNPHPGIVSLYLEGEDGSESVCINKVGTYNLPDDPMLVAVVMDPTYSIDFFGPHVIVYKTDDEASYRVTTSYEGAYPGDITIEGSTATIPLILEYGYETVTFDYPCINTWTNTLYYANYGGYMAESSTSTYPETSTFLKEQGIPNPDGMVLDCWTYYSDGSGKKLTPGDTSVYLAHGSVLYAQWKESGGGGGPTTFTVTEDTANAFAGIVDLYLVDLTESGTPLCINDAGTYTLSEDPVIKAVVKDSTYSANVFGDGAFVYKEGAGASYEIMKDLDGTIYTLPFFDGTTVKIAFTPDSSADTVSFAVTSVYKWTYDVYFVNNGTMDLVVWESDYPETVETLGITVPAGKTFKCWSTNKDGSGDTFKPGSSDVIPRGLFLYAQWVDA